MTGFYPRKMLAVFIQSAMILCTLLCTFCFSQMSIEEEENAYYRSKRYIPIKGEQESDYPKGIYLVTDDVVVEKGKTMTFMPGTVVLFKKDTRITIQGRLICQGNAKAPITFCRFDNDKYLIPLENGIDARWDGLFVAGDGSLEFSHSNISGSKYGIEAEDAKSVIALDTVVFRDNKFQNLKVADVTLIVPENQFVFYSSKRSQGLVQKLGAYLDSTQERIQKASNAWKLPVRIGLAALAVSGAVAGVYGLSEYDKYNDLYEQTRIPGTGVAQKVAQYDTKRKSGANTGIVGAVLCAIGLAGFSVTFAF